MLRTEDGRKVAVNGYWFKWNERYLNQLLTLREYYIVGWAMPTKYKLSVNDQLIESFALLPLTFVLLPNYNQHLKLLTPSIA